MSTPARVHVRVDRVESKDVPVEVNVTGTPDDGYRAGKPTTATKKVTVSGPATDLAQVSKAVACRGCYRPQFLAGRLRMQGNPV